MVGFGSISNSTGIGNETSGPPQYPYGIVPLDTPGLIAATTFCTVFFFACFIGAFWIALNRDSTIIQRSQPATLFLSFFGLALLNGTILLGLGRPMSVGLCVGKLWGVQLALLTFLASQVMKGWALFRFAQTSRSRPIRVSEERTLVASFVFLIVFALIIVLWTIFEPVGPSADYAGCVSDGKVGEVAALTCLSVLWAIWFFFAAHTSHLKTRLIEYNALVCFCAGLAASMAIVATHADQTVFTPEVRLVTEASCAGFVTLVVLLCGVIPKLRFTEEELREEQIEEMLEKQEDDAARSQRLRRGTSHSTRTQSLTSFQGDDIGRMSQYSTHSRPKPELADNGGDESHMSARKTTAHSHRGSLSSGKSGSRRKLSRFSSRGSVISVRSRRSTNSERHHNSPRRRHTYHSNSPDGRASPELVRIPRSRSTTAMTVFSPPPSFTDEGAWL